MITVQVEDIKSCWDELSEIFPVHHAELGLFRDRMLLRPQTAEYIRRNQDGKLLLVTVRENSAIVAYYTVQIARGFHYDTTLVGTMDMAYVHPNARNRGLAFPLFRRVEKELKKRGVQVWYSGFKEHKPLGMPGLLDSLGFQLADAYRAKWIGAT